ncbi:MAG TPA: glycoside hydrolase family 57 protein [Candidatus Kapabacteria bacterium]
MIPIKLAILWHQHQPYYKADGKFHLPWVRLHTTKDYAEMAEHIACFPKLHATINLVPSLIGQIESYMEGVEDDVLKLSRKPTTELTNDEKIYLIENCFHANPDRMIKRSARYQELRKKTEQFTDEDYRDLVVHYALAWLGEFERKTEFYSYYIDKDRGYTEKEKDELFSELHTLFLYTLEIHRRLAASGQVEISTTPFYHPILPLLCDTNSAHEALPELTLPDKRFASAGHAAEQVKRGLSFMEERFGNRPSGIWPSEGSISNGALDVMASQGVKWTASDEAVLLKSLKDFEYEELEKYFPRRYSSGGNEITIFFRDHNLSDKIGFDYQSWSADDAAADMIESIRDIRQEIFERYGEEALQKACIPIILDGENCWEYYEANGYHFLQAFYKALSEADDIQTVTFTEAIADIGSENIRPIENVTAGSWINGNFKIWIGHKEKNRGWELLTDAAEIYDSLEGDDANFAQTKELAFRELIKAQGSDWFWWYGDDHHSEQKNIFDELFRLHLTNFYKILGHPVPTALSFPIGIEVSKSVFSSMRRAS